MTASSPTAVTGGAGSLRGSPARIQRMLERGWRQIESQAGTWAFVHPDRDGAVTLPAEGPDDEG